MTLDLSYDYCRREENGAKIVNWMKKESYQEYSVHTNPCTRKKTYRYRPLKSSRSASWGTFPCTEMIQTREKRPVWSVHLIDLFEACGLFPQAALSSRVNDLILGCCGWGRRLYLTLSSRFWLTLTMSRRSQYSEPHIVCTMHRGTHTTWVLGPS